MITKQEIKYFHSVFMDSFFDLLMIYSKTDFEENVETGILTGTNKYLGLKGRPFLTVK